MADPSSRFKPGRSGNPAGRPKGIPNRVTIEAREAASQLVDDPRYRARLLADLRQRKVAPAVEVMLWHYAKGRPVERVEHSAQWGLTAAVIERLSDEALEEALGLLGKLQELLRIDSAA